MTPRSFRMRDSPTANFPMLDVFSKDHLAHLMGDAIGQGLMGCDDFSSADRQ